MRAIRSCLLLLSLTIPSLAHAATPGRELAIPPGCRGPQDKDDIQPVIEACSGALKTDTATSGARRAWLYFFRAYAYVELGRIDDAKADLDAAIAADPSVANPHHEMAYVLTELGDFDGAEAEANKALQLEPADMEHVKERAFARLQKGDYGPAAEDYARVLARGEDSLVRPLRAYALALHGDIDEAKADMAKVPADQIKSGTYSAMAQQMLDVLSPADKAADPAGRCDKGFAGGFLKKETASFCTAAMRATGSARDRANALRVRSLTWHYALDLPEPAKSDIEAAVRLNPNDDATVGQRCTILTATATVRRQVKRAIIDCTRAIELCKSANCVVHNAGRANAYLAVDDFKAALADAEVVIAGRPDLDEGYRIRGEAKLGLADNEGAKADLIEARRRGGKSDHLKTLLAKVGVKMEDVPVEQSAR